MTDDGMNREETANARILIADDQDDVLTSLQLLLKGMGYTVEKASSPQAVLRIIREHDFDVVLMDLNYTRGSVSGAEGLDLLSRIREIDESLPVVVMTAWASISLALKTVRCGARDFVEKPWNNERLLGILRTQVDLRRALLKGARLESENRFLRREGQVEIVAESKAMMPVLQSIQRIGPSDANVLITGENGTGKAVVAQMLHASSRRADRQMVTVNIGGLPEGVFESELFGHVKGAFTDAKSDREGRFEIADGGTLFLDEIANVSLNMQGRLLRVIETGRFERIGSSRTRRANVRIISATNSDLNEDVAQGRFRADLLYRLNTVEIHVPPLRERREDIAVLAEYFLRRHARHYRKDIEGFDSSAMRAMLAHTWPGNVRELDHAIERSVLMADSNVIQPFDLALQAGSARVRSLEEMSLEEVEKLLIAKALTRSDGNVTRAADSLGLSRSALYRRMGKYGL